MQEFVAVQNQIDELVENHEVDYDDFEYKILKTVALFEEEISLGSATSVDVDRHLSTVRNHLRKTDFSIRDVFPATRRVIENFPSSSCIRVDYIMNKINK
jgi:hypothetical protein